MKVGVIGRTKLLFDTVEYLLKAGHEVPFIYTCRSESFYHCTEHDFKVLAKAIGADFYCDNNINDPQCVAQVSQYDCDVAMSINWLSLFKSSICKAFHHGIWNAHAGDLPRYRGNACPNWAILNNEPVIALSIHEVEPEVLDSGDILLKEYYELTQSTYISDIYRWLEYTTPRLLLTALHKLRDNELDKTSQSSRSSDILRCYPRKPQDARVDWSQDAISIHRIIRASSEPFQGAFCYLEDGRFVRIWRAEVVEHHRDFLAVPGQVLYGVGGDPVIACGKNTLKLTHCTTQKKTEDMRGDILKSLRNRLMSYPGENFFH